MAIKLQTEISLSTTESEFVSLSRALQTVINIAKRSWVGPLQVLDIHFHCQEGVLLINKFR
jgi:hypothetical protein